MRRRVGRNPLELAERGERRRRHVRRDHPDRPGADVGDAVEVKPLPEREPDGVSVGGRRVAADAGLLRRIARDDLRGNEHVLHAFLADAEPLQRAQAVGQRPVDDLSGSVDRGDHERRVRGLGDRRRHGPRSGKTERLDGHADRHVVDRGAQAGPQLLVERVAAIARVGPQCVREAGHGHRDLEQVLAPGGEVIEARPQPVARHQRRRFGRGDAGRAAGGSVSAEQGGGARRDRGIDEDRIGREVRERRRWRPARAAQAARPHDDEAAACHWRRPPRGFPRRRRPDFRCRPIPVGDCDDPTFAQANAQVTARMATLRKNAPRNLLVLLITTAADSD